MKDGHTILQMECVLVQYGMKYYTGTQPWEATCSIVMDKSEQNTVKKLLGTGLAILFDRPSEDGKRNSSEVECHLI